MTIFWQCINVLNYRLLPARTLLFEDSKRSYRSRRKHRIRVGRNNVYVDGYDSVTSTVYQFHGRFYHGYPSCFLNKNIRHPKHGDMTMREKRQQTAEREQSICEA